MGRQDTLHEQLRLLAVVFGLLAPVPLSGQTRIGWANTDAIVAADVVGGAITVLAPTFSPHDLEAARDVWIWTEVLPNVPALPSGRIRSLRSDGSHPETLIDHVDAPGGLAIDAAEGWLFWSDLTYHTISRMQLDDPSSNKQILADQMEVAQILDVEVDATAKKLYFSFVNPLIDSLYPGAIARMNYDGSELETVVTGLLEPRSLALDPSGQQLYVMDGYYRADGVIKWLDLNSRETGDLLGGIKDGYGLAFDSGRGRLLWTDQVLNTVSAVDLRDHHVELYFADQRAPRAVAMMIVPEPTTAVVLLTGVSCLVWVRRQPSARHDGGCR